jgi:hypothetical protein
VKKGLYQQASTVLEEEIDERRTGVLASLGSSPTICLTQSLEIVNNSPVPGLLGSLPATGPASYPLLLARVSHQPAGVLRDPGPFDAHSSVRTEATCQRAGL